MYIRRNYSIASAETKVLGTLIQQLMKRM